MREKIDYYDSRLRKARNEFWLFAFLKKKKKSAALNSLSDFINFLFTAWLK